MSALFARRGVWTPWASVLCLECDYQGLTGCREEIYRDHARHIANMNRLASVPRERGQMIATCDSCKVECWVRDDVALLQRVGRATTGMDWSLEQTGGMCSALLFRTESRLVVVTAMDGSFLVGEYSAADEEWVDPLRSWQSDEFPLDDDDQIDETRIQPLVERCAALCVGMIRSVTDPEALKTQHESAAGAACLEGDNGMCLMCGVEMTHCNVCQGIGYHRDGCQAQACESHAAEPQHLGQGQCPRCGGWFVNE